MNEQTEDRLQAEARKLATDIAPQRDLWPGIEEAIRSPRRARWTPMLAQAAAALLLVGASSMVTYYVVRDTQPPVEVLRPALNAETAAYGARSTLGREYQQTHGNVASSLRKELQRLSPEARADVERNLAVIRDAIADINGALAEEPDNPLLQELLAEAYRDELAIMQRVGNLTQQVMSRQDI